MADVKKAAVKKPMSVEAKLALYKKIEIPISGSKEKIVNYEDQEVEVTAIEGCKHMKAGETYPVGSSTAVILIERGWAELAK